MDEIRITLRPWREVCPKNKIAKNLSIWLACELEIFRMINLLNINDLNIHTTFSLLYFPIPFTIPNVSTGLIKITFEEWIFTIREISHRELRSSKHKASEPAEPDIEGGTPPQPKRKLAKKGKYQRE